MFKLRATLLKDIRILWRDKVGIALMFIMPIILVTVVTSIQNSTFQLINKNKLPILICNRDTGQASAQLIGAINKIGLFKVSEVRGAESERAMTNAMHTHDAMLGVVVPPDFSAKVSAKSKNIAGKA